MKRKHINNWVRAACLGLTVLLIPLMALGQDQDPNDPGGIDSLWFDGLNVPLGVSRPIFLWIQNDEDIEAIMLKIVVFVDSVPDIVQFDSVTFFPIPGTDPLTLDSRTVSYSGDVSGDYVDTLEISMSCSEQNHVPLPTYFGRPLALLWFTGLKVGDMYLSALPNGVGARIWPDGNPPGGDGYFVPYVGSAHLVVGAGVDPLDPGLPDTLRASVGTLEVGTSGPVTVSLANDEAIEGFDLSMLVGTEFGTDALLFDSLRFVGRMADPSILDSRTWTFERNDNGYSMDTLSLFAEWSSQHVMLPPGSGPILEVFFTPTLPCGNVGFNVDLPFPPRIWPEGTTVGGEGYFIPLAFSASTIAGVSPDPLLRDTLRIEPAQISQTESSPVVISLFTDEAVKSFSFKFIVSSVDGGAARFDSLRWVGRLADPNVAALRGWYDMGDGNLPDTVLAQGWDLYGTEMPVGDGPVAELYFTGTSPGQIFFETSNINGNGSEGATTLRPVSGSWFEPYVRTAACDVGEPAAPAPVFEPVPTPPEPTVAGNMVTFEVAAESPISNPVEVNLLSFYEWDSPTQEPIAAPIFDNTVQPALFMWTPALEDIGIWRATFEAVDQISGRVATTEVIVQIVSGPSYLTSFEVTETVDAQTATGMVHGDFDHDGYPELLVSSDPWATGKSLGVYDHAGSGALNEVFYLTEDYPNRGVAVGYLNEDDYLDVVTCMYDEIWVLHGNGDNTFTVYDGNVPRPEGTFIDATLSDFNGDAYLDYVCLTSPDRIAVYAGDADSHFENALLFSAGDQVLSLASTDLDGNGYDDLTVGTPNGLQVYLNNGEGSYDLAHFYDQPFGTQDIDITDQGSDFNNDGNYDLCVASPGTGANPDMSDLMVYLGQGDGSFQSIVVRLIQGRVYSTRAGDFNGDGQLDIAYINATEQYLGIAFGDGTGAFPSVLRFDVPAYAPQWLDCLDIDADGDLDVVVSSYWLGPTDLRSSLYVYRNGLNPAVNGLSLRLSVLDNADIEIVAPNGGRLNRVSNAIPSSSLYRRNLDGDDRIDRVASASTGQTGRYDLVVSPRPNLAPGETFSLDYQIGNGFTFRIARDLPMSESGYVFPIFASEESPIQPKQGGCVRTLRPVFEWKDIWFEPYARQGSMPVPDLQAEFQLASDPGFNDIIESAEVDGGRYSYQGIMAVSDSTSFFWRVRPVGSTEWDHVFVFHALPAGDIPKDPVDRDDNGEVGDPTDPNGQGDDDQVAVDAAGAIEIPVTYQLSQNYPNPFNPVTQLRYGLPRATTVRLEIFNVLGQKIATLVDGPVEAGYHVAVWDAGDVASGIYFYRLVAGDFTETKKMLLLK